MYGKKNIQERGKNQKENASFIFLGEFFTSTNIWQVRHEYCKLDARK